MKLTEKGRKFRNYFLIGLTVLGGVFLLYKFNPTLRAKVAGQFGAINLSKEQINNINTEAEIPLGTVGKTSPAYRDATAYKIGMYAWSAEFGLIASNGGIKTAQGSLMEKQGISLKLIRQNSYDALIESLSLFAKEFDSGSKYARNDLAYNGVVAMGDGTPFFVSNVQRSLDEKFNGKYHVQAIAVIGVSYGEDKIIAPYEWRDNPQLAIGKVLTTVPGDGDWVLTMNWAALNNIPVNPNLGTYDATKLNIWASNGGEYTESAREVVQSQSNGQMFPMDEIVNDVKTGKKLMRPIDACATWSPADEIALSKLASKGYTNIFSTKEASNQMPCTLYVIKEWAEQNKEDVVKMLSAIYTAGNQIKQYPTWFDYASQAAAEVFQEKSPEFWKKIYNSYPIETSVKGVVSSVGGSRVFNLADARQYLGMDDEGENHFLNVYNAVNGYIDAMGMRDDIKVNLSYSDAVSHKFVASVEGISAGQKEEINYDRVADNVVTKGNFDIRFAIGSAELLSSNKSQLEALYNALAQASGLKISIEGHTDNTGSSQVNETLSFKRAQAVKYWLLDRGVNGKRIQSVEGFGPNNPIAPNTNEAGRAKNRRVTISLLD